MALTLKTMACDLLHAETRGGVALRENFRVGFPRPFGLDQRTRRCPQRDPPNAETEHGCVAVWALSMPQGSAQRTCPLIVTLIVYGSLVTRG